MDIHKGETKKYRNFCTIQKKSSNFAAQTGAERKIHMSAPEARGGIDGIMSLRGQKFRFRPDIGEIRGDGRYDKR